MCFFTSLYLFCLLIGWFIPFDRCISFVCEFVLEFHLISAVDRVLLISPHDDLLTWYRDIPTTVMSVIADLIGVGTGA